MRLLTQVSVALAPVASRSTTAMRGWFVPSHRNHAGLAALSSRVTVRLAVSGGPSGAAGAAGAGAAGGSEARVPRA